MSREPDTPRRGGFARVARVAVVGFVLGCTPRTRPPTEPTEPPVPSAEAYDQARQQYALAVEEGRLDADCDAIATALEQAVAPGDERKAQALLDAATVWAECGDQAKASALLRQLSDHPEARLRARAFNGLAALASERGDPSEAWDHLQRATDADPQWSLPVRNQLRLCLAMIAHTGEPTWLQRGEALADHMDSQGHAGPAAVARLRLRVETWARNPTPNTTRPLRAALDESLARDDLADEDVAALLLMRGRVLLDAGTLHAAVTDFRAAAERTPASGEPLAYLAIAAGRLRDYESVYDLSTRSLDDPAMRGRVHVHVMQGIALTQLERFKEADDSLSRAKRLAGEEPGALLLVQRARQMLLDARLGLDDPWDRDYGDDQVKLADHLLTLLEQTQGRPDLEELRQWITADLPRRGGWCGHPRSPRLCELYGDQASLLPTIYEDPVGPTPKELAAERKRLLKIEKKAIEAFELEQESKQLTPDR